MLQYKQVKIGERLCSQDTREWFLVVHKSSQGIFVINLMLPKNNPANIFLILPSFFDKWDRDGDISTMEEWEKELMQTKSSIINDVKERSKGQNLILSEEEEYEPQENGQSISQTI